MGFLNGEEKELGKGQDEKGKNGGGMFCLSLEGIFNIYIYTYTYTQEGRRTRAEHKRKNWAREFMHRGRHEVVD